MARYLAFNGPTQTTAAPAKVATGTAAKTLLQIAPKSGVDLRVISWGISFDGSAAATPGVVELIETDVAATVTAYVTGDVTRYDNPGGPAADTALITLGTAASGYTASAEGSITVVRTFDLQQIAPTAQYVMQYPIGDRPLVQAGKFLRVRVTFGTTVNALCWVRFGPDSQD